MDFPILSLIDDERAEEWLLNHFHPEGLFCPHCEAAWRRHAISEQQKQVA